MVSLLFSPGSLWQCDEYRLVDCFMTIDYVERVAGFLDEEGASVEGVKAELKDFLRVNSFRLQNATLTLIF